MWDSLPWEIIKETELKEYWTELAEYKPVIRKDE